MTFGIEFPSSTIANCRNKLWSPREAFITRFSGVGCRAAFPVHGEIIRAQFVTQLVLEAFLFWLCAKNEL